jgi:hypothetical protein
LLSIISNLVYFKAPVRGAKRCRPKHTHRRFGSVPERKGFLQRNVELQPDVYLRSAIQYRKRVTS